ncbi:MAG: hypothetical protein M1840_005742 [Geoglossum simile]|nr:MAG: hypothetical protein M1840_005742 [Geoglossum simile]
MQLLLEAQPNAKLFPPFILRVQIRDKNTSEAIPAEEQLSHIWAIISPIDEDNRNTFSSPSAFVSNGRLCDSLHPLHDSDGNISSFLIFQDVAFCNKDDAYLQFFQEQEIIDVLSPLPSLL